MFRSLLAGKSRHRAAVVAGALAGVITPLAAHASLTVTMSLSSTAAGSTSAVTTQYVDPTSGDVPVYVWATVTGTNAADFQALQYAYYNINNKITSTGAATVDASKVPAGGGAFGATTSGFSTAFAGRTNGTPPVFSSQFGTIANTPNGLSVGDASGTDETKLVKADASIGSPVFGAAGTTASFLLEKILVAPGAFTASTTSTLSATRFFPQIPTAAQFNAEGSALSGANWNEDSTVATGNGSAGNLGASPQVFPSQRHTTVVPFGTNAAANAATPQTQDATAGTYTAPTTGAGVAIVNTIGGDTDDNGAVNITDFNTLAANFGSSTGNTWKTGDFDGNGAVNITDFNILAGNFGANITTLSPNLQSLSLAPLAAFAAENNDTVAFNAAIAASDVVVPEPASISLLGLGAVSLLARKRRTAR